MRSIQLVGALSLTGTPAAASIAALLIIKLSPEQAPHRLIVDPSRDIVKCGVSQLDHAAS